MSFTSLPRCRICTGLRMPTRIGPTASACASSCTSLAAMLPAASVGKISTFASPCRRFIGYVSRRIASLSAVLACISPSMIRSGARRRTIASASWMVAVCGWRTLPKFEKLNRATRGVTSKLAGQTGRQDGDFGQRLGVRVNVDRRVREEEHAVARRDHVDSGGHPALGGGADDLQRRTQDVGIVEAQARHHAVGVVELDHQRGEIARIGRQLPGLASPSRLCGCVARSSRSA